MKSFHYKLKTTQLGTKYIYLRDEVFFIMNSQPQLGTKHI
jgi:hypothetical protein